MIDCTQNEDGTFTISWDENDPIESMLNDWTEADFNEVLRNYAEEIFANKEFCGEDPSKFTKEYRETSNISEATQKDWEDFWNSESEGRDTAYLKATNQETFGQVYHSPEAQGSWDQSDEF